LILAGGGIRVAYQAGVVRALHEAGLRFAHGDGASGGILNLAMLCSGLSPEEMCDRWRSLNPRDSISLLPLHKYARPHALPAMGDADGMVEKVFPHLNIDLSRVNAVEGMDATFNVCNYTRKTNIAFHHTQVDRDLLIAGVSLPIFLPPVQRDGEQYLDSVWIRDANLMEAVRRGAEELWVVWCIGNAPEYADGTFTQYVHMIELSANGALYEEFDRIAELNDRIARGDSPYGQTRRIRLHLIRPEYPLPLDPDYYLNHIDGATLVAMGYADAIAYLDQMSDEGMPYSPDVTRMAASSRGFSFRERMTGPFALGQQEPAAALKRNTIGRTTLDLHLAINIRDLKAFIADTDHTAELVGTIHLSPFGMQLPCRRGFVKLFAPTASPAETRMIYQLGFRHEGREYTLHGEKHVRKDAGFFELWKDTTTLFVRLHEGLDTSGPVAGAGVAHIGPIELVRLVGSAYATGVSSLPSRLSVMTRFSGFFASQVWRIYGPGKPRATSRMAENGEASPESPAASAQSRSGSLRFTEEMKGFVGFGDIEPGKGFTTGKDHGTNLMVHLTIAIDDIRRFASDPDHTASAEGWVGCEALGGRLPIERGTFNLFAGDDPRRKQMRYRLFFRDGVGHPLTLTGFKAIEDDPGLDLWPDTTTLYVRVLAGHIEAGEEMAGASQVAAGIIRIHPRDFLRQLTTFRTGGRSPLDHLVAASTFGSLWVRNIVRVYVSGAGPRKVTEAGTSPAP
jgi:predicted acylesterase/phospholipase RssA